MVKTNNKEGKIKDPQEIGLVRPMAITIKAVVVSTQSGKVLLLKRSRKELFNKNKWDLPGGHIEKGETIEESLKREVMQETGLKIEVGPLLQFTEFEKSHKAFKQEKRGLRFIALSESEDVELGKEHSKFVWLTFEDAIKKLSNDGFEKEKKEVMVLAKQRIEMEEVVESWKRTVADFENFKKRTETSNEEFRKFCLEGYVNDLLPVLDNFEMATDHIPEDQKDSPWITGIMHIKKQLKNVLATQGVSEIKSKPGEKIDVSKHEVIISKDKNGSSKVSKVLKKGYEMNGKVIRPAIVEAK
ncbi:MAG: nucleotide exchange factor GrpE [Patescibacteria group bacterium]|nr:nucleotide exchange factor GrpE [Patescibacteria group bacterium]